MSYEVGAFKWFIGMLMAPVGYVSLYIFGDGIWNTVTHFQALVHFLSYLNRPNILVTGLLEIYVPTPESFIASLVIYPVVGGIVGATAWYFATS